MKKVQKTIALSLLTAVTFMTLSSFTTINGSSVIGTASSVNTNTVNIDTNEKTSHTTLLVVLVYSLFAATPTSNSNSCGPGVPQASVITTNSNFALSKLG